MASNVVPITNNLSTSNPVEKNKPGRKAYVLTPPVCDKILSLAKDGMSVRQISKALDVPSSTVSRALQDQGFSAVLASLAKAKASQSTYNSQRRINLLDAILEKASLMLPLLDKPGSLYGFVLGVAIAIDKRRLEDADTVFGGASAILDLVGRLSVGTQSPSTQDV